MDLYTLNKIDHMRRTGLVAGTSSGIGKNGGACPDWLAKDQKDRDEKMRIRADLRQIGRASTHG